MIKNNVQSLGSAIREYLKEEKLANGIDLNRKMAEMNAINNWSKIIGLPIARVTKSITIKNQVLTITLTSSIVRNQLYMMRTDIIDAMNRHADMEIVKSIVLK